MTTPTSTKPAKKKRHDAFVARVTITIPIDLADPDSVPSAVKAVAAIEKTLPEGAIFKSENTLSRI